MDTIIIEPDGQPQVVIAVEPAPEIVFQDIGLQGVPGPASHPGSGDGIKVIGEVVNVDISSLTLAP